MALGLVIVSHAVLVRRREHLTLTLVLALDTVVGVVGLVALLDPERFASWMQEDAWAEWCTFFAFLVAAALQVESLAATRRARRPRLCGLVDRAAYVGVALFCVFVAGEEVSWGQRLFAWQPPEIFLEENYQQELNVHNVLKDREVLGLQLESRNLVALIAILYGVLLPLLSRTRGRLAELLELAAPSLHWAPWFMLVALAEVTYPVDLTGEAAEMALGLVFIADIAERRTRLAAGRHPVRTAIISFLAPVALGITAPAAIDATLYGPDEPLRTQAARELEQLASDLRFELEGYPRLTVRRRVHKRVFTALRQGYWSFGERSAFLEGRASPAESEAGRRDRRGYFLDPWNNAYWVHASRDRRSVVLYSFGPNRRRDSDLDASSGLRGDDIGVRLDVPDERR